MALALLHPQKARNRGGSPAELFLTTKIPYLAIGCNTPVEDFLSQQPAAYLAASRFPYLARPAVLRSVPRGGTAKGMAHGGSARSPQALSHHRALRTGPFVE